MIDSDLRSDAELLAATPADPEAFATFYLRHVHAVLSSSPSERSATMSATPLHSLRTQVSSKPPPPLHTSRVLEGNGIGQATFGEHPQTVVRQLSALLRRPPSKPYSAAGACSVDHEIDWPGLRAYFRHGRFVGYA
jgi:hypothetical protein